MNKIWFENGMELMLVDCGDYQVELIRSLHFEVRRAIKFTNVKEQIQHHTPSTFFIDWDTLTGMMLLQYNGVWGDEMKFVIYPPHPYKEMFDFIGKGFGIFPKIKVDKV